MTNPVHLIAKQKIVEELVNNIGVPALYKQDLIQEVYLILLEYDSQTLQELIDKNQIKFFISRICTNTWYSKTSPFYKKYKKFNQNKTKTIQDLINEEEHQNNI